MRKEKKDADRQVLQANRSGVFQVECQGTNFGALDNRTIADSARNLAGAVRANRENLLTRKGSAEFLGISLRKLDQLVSAHELAVAKFGRSVRIDPRELDRYVENRTRASKGGRR